MCATLSVILLVLCVCACLIALCVHLSREDIYIIDDVMPMTICPLLYVTHLVKSIIT